MHENIIESEDITSIISGRFFPEDFLLTHARKGSEICSFHGSKRQKQRFQNTVDLTLKVLPTLCINLD